MKYRPKKQTREIFPSLSLWQKLIFYWICGQITVLPINATLNTIAWSNSLKSRPVSFLIFSRRYTRVFLCTNSFSGSLRNVEVIFKEFLDSKQGLVVKAVNGTFLKYLFEEHFTQCGWQLINQTGNTKVVVATIAFSVSNTFPTSRETCASLKDLLSSFTPETMVPIPTTTRV